MFVFSHKTAPAGQRPLVRFGRDLLVTWDAEDPATDPFLLAALEIARFLCFESRRRTESQAADFAGIDEAILDIEKRAANLETVRTSAQTIRSSSEKILDRVRIDRVALDKQVAVLREKLDDLRAG